MNQPSSIQPVDIADRMEASFLDYAMSVIVARALPDIRDGLKPVQRRILYAMFEAGLLADRSHRKCASVVGDVMKKYHPHGDSSIYEALVRMAQDFVTREPLIDGRGNFGSIDGDPPAAFRYTEARLSPIAMQLLADIDDDTVAFEPNYDGHEVQPEVLPARFPNLLVNGASGIAVGFATSIPPHNLSEAIAACKEVITNPTATLDQVMTHLPAPDFPTGARILVSDDIRTAYATGKGSIQMEAVAATETRSGGLPRIVITEIPYQVNKSALIAKIADLTKAKRLDGIRDLRDESSRDGMRIVIELKRGVDPMQMLDRLYDLTDLRSNFSVNMVALHEGRPKTLGLMEILHAYVAHQREVITRRTQYRLTHARQRLHIIDGLLIALDNLDDVIGLIRAAASAAAARTELMAQFGMSEPQATAVLDMQLRRLAQLEHHKLIEEAESLRTLIERLCQILDDPTELDRVLISELDDIDARFANPRRTHLINPDTNSSTHLSPQLAAQAVTVYISAGGYIKPVAQQQMSAAHSGQDPAVAVMRCNGDAQLLLVSSTGEGTRVNLTDIGVVSARQRGMMVTEPGTTLAGAVPLDLQGPFDLITVSAKGFVKRTPLKEYDTRNRTIAATGVKPGDAIVACLLLRPGGQIMLASNRGQAIVFDSDEIRPTGRTTTGVAAMKLPSDAYVVSATVIDPDHDVLVLGENGAMKRVPASDFPVQGRNGKGVLTGIGTLAFAGSGEVIHAPTEVGWTVVRPETVPLATRSKTPDPGDSTALGKHVSGRAIPEQST
ncbi:DNA topoisomerase (ATP-hydrolyzing) [Stomatohabitans albus]|uniref:DNA gyrase/topoisomerase IV subunit A n=1 Tax=Stomatohabitans albus TaxID=3110766 RepID=UPI00300CB228